MSCCRWWEIQHQYSLREAKDSRDRRLWEWLWSRIWATLNCHSIQVYPFSCSEITFQEIFAEQIFIVQHSSRITSEGYSNFSCPYRSPVKVEQIVSKPRNNSSVNITNLVHIVNFGGYVEYTEHRHTLNLIFRCIKQHIIKSLHHELKQTYCAGSLGKLKNLTPCLLDEEHSAALEVFVFMFILQKQHKIITPLRYP